MFNKKICSLFVVSVLRAMMASVLVLIYIRGWNGIEAPPFEFFVLSTAFYSIFAYLAFQHTKKIADIMGFDTSDCEASSVLYFFQGEVFFLVVWGVMWLISNFSI